MHDHTLLMSIAYKAERAASRKLAAGGVMSDEAALRLTLAAVAGGSGIDTLVAERLAVSAAAEARALRKREQQEAARLVRDARHAGAGATWRGWFDGSAHPNPGRCGLGALLLGPSGERIEIARGAGYGSSSEAEYLALIALLQAAVAAGAYDVAIHGDSQVVIGDVTGLAVKAAPSLADLRTQATALIAQIDGVVIRWIPRHRNGDADALSQRAVAGWESDPCEQP